MCKSIIEKKKKMHDKTVLLEKSKLHSMEVLISTVLIDSNIIHEDLFLLNNVLREYRDMKKEIRYFRT